MWTAEYFAMTKHPELTELQQEFVRIYVSTGGQNATQCAIAAGYSPNGAGVTAHRLLNRPNIIEAIRIETERVFRSSAPVAAGVILYLAKSAKNESVRLQAAESWLNRAGMMVVNKSEHRTVVEDRRTTEELIQYATRLARELGLDAKVIDGRPVIDALPAPLAEPVVEERVENSPARELAPGSAAASLLSEPDDAEPAPVTWSVPAHGDDDADLA